MKTAGYPFGFRLLLLVLLLLLPWSVPAESQHPYYGLWEGNFMGDFRTVLLIASGEDTPSGTIRMYNGSRLIQDDLITGITVNGKALTFQIPAKETSFHGEFNDPFDRLTGKFIFPDGTEHPIEVRKPSGGEQVSLSGPEQYREYLDRKYDPESLREDLQYLIDHLAAHHPRLFAYTTEEELNATRDRILSELNRPMEVDEFFGLVAPLVDMVRCSHTGIRLPREYGSLAAEYGYFIPLKVSCHGEHIYLMSACGEALFGIEAGTEISRINGIPAGQIITRLLTLVPAEGSNTTAKYHQLNQRFSELYHVLDQSAHFELEFRTPEGKRTINLQGCPLKELADTAAGREEMPIEFSMDISGSTGKLRVSSFEIRDMEGYMSELERMFTQLRTYQIRNLILDLRGNAGGHPIFAAQLLSYLVDEGFTYFRTNPEISEFEPLYRPMRPDPLHFKGELFVLVDGGCLSTTGHLISQIKYHTSALFIGEEPGSTFRCNDFSIQVSLPHTGIEATIPRTTFESAVEGFREGDPFPIDYQIPFNISDILKGANL